MVSAQTNTLRPIFNEVVTMFLGHWFLKHFLIGDSPINRNAYEIRLRTDVDIKGRIPGGQSTTEGTGLQAVHTSNESFAVVDEASFISSDALAYFKGVISPKTRVFISGIPTIAMDSMLYKLDHEPQGYSPIYTIGTIDNPETTEESLKHAIAGFGGPNSAKTQMLVFGNWSDDLGKMSFDMEKVLKDKGPYFQRKLNYEDYPIEYIKKEITLPPVPKQGDKDGLVFAMDYGSRHHPSIMGIYYPTKGESGVSWRLFFKLHLIKFGSYQQAEIIDWLDKHYNFCAIGVDIGGPGIEISQHLTNEALFGQRDYNDRLVLVGLGEKLVVDTRLETPDEMKERLRKTNFPSARDMEPQILDIKSEMKEFCVNSLRNMFYNQELFIPEADEEIDIELATTTEEGKLRSGRTVTVYSTPEADHNFQMFQVFAGTLKKMTPIEDRKLNKDLYLEWYGAPEKQAVGGLPEIGEPLIDLIW